MKTAPLVSVIVPCWNGSSTDGTPEVAARLTEPRRRIRVARQRQRGIGAVGAVVPASVRGRLGPVLRGWLEG